MPKKKGILADRNLTALQVAEQLSTSARTVRRHAAEKNIDEVIGVQRLFAAADVEQLRGHIRPTRGNPLMGKEQPKTWHKKKLEQ